MPMSAPTAPRATSSTTDLALIATFAALIAVCAVSAALPIGVNGVPLTLQMFAVFLAGAVLGPIRGFLSVALYLVLGAAGLPIFAGGQAGLAPFSGPTAGYLLAFPVAAFIIGATAVFAVRLKAGLTAIVLFAGGVVAELVVTLAGAGSIAIAGATSYPTAIKLALAYLPGDLVKLAVAAVVAAAVHRAFPRLLAARR